MERVDITNIKLEEGYISPSEGGRLNRSFLNYQSGIKELDDYLINNKFSKLGAEFGIEIYDSVVIFHLYRGKKMIWQYSISRKNILRVDSLHDQMLNIRKDSFVSAGVLGVLPVMPIIGGLTAMAIDAIQTRSKDIPVDQLVKGSIFEIVVNNSDSSTEKIIISSSKKHSEVISNFLKHTIDFKKNVSKAGCYIATVCYGDSNCIEVITFKRYRDQQLSKSFWGRIFIKIYYLISPSISKFLVGRNSCNRFIKTYFLNAIYARIK